MRQAPEQTPPIWPAACHPGQAKREPGSQKGKCFNLLRSRIMFHLSGMTPAAIQDGIEGVGLKAA